MAADKGKKLKVAERVEDQDDNSDEIDTEIILSIEKLQEVQDDLEKLNEEASAKVLEVEQKYNEICRPVFKKRNETIKPIPDFWLTAFLSHPDLNNLMNAQDRKILKHMDFLDVEDFKDMKSGYSITFGFKNNPYFQNTKLKKTFTFNDEGETKVTGTTINWNEGMGAVDGIDQEKKGNKRPFGEDSFFTWFNETAPHDIAELQDEVAETIKEDIWPNPLKYFHIGPDDVEDDPNENPGNAGKDKQDGDGSDGNN